MGVMEMMLIRQAKKDLKKQPDVPTDEDAAEAKRKRQEELRRRKGRGASIVTGGAGLTDQQPQPLGQTSLLGSA